LIVRFYPSRVKYPTSYREPMMKGVVVGMIWPNLPVRGPNTTDKEFRESIDRQRAYCRKANQGQAAVAGALPIWLIIGIAVLGLVAIIGVASIL